MYILDYVRKYTSDWLIFDSYRYPIKHDSLSQVCVGGLQCTVCSIPTHRQYADVVRVRCQAEDAVREGRTQQLTDVCLDLFYISSRINAHIDFTAETGD